MKLKLIRNSFDRDTIEVRREEKLPHGGTMQLLLASVFIDSFHPGDIYDRLRSDGEVSVELNICEENDNAAG